MYVHFISIVFLFYAYFVVKLKSLIFEMVYLHNNAIYYHMQYISTSIEKGWKQTSWMHYTSTEQSTHLQNESQKGEGSSSPA